MQISPKAREQRVRLQERLVELGYVRAGLETTVQRFKNQMHLFAEEVLPRVGVQLPECAVCEMGSQLTIHFGGHRARPYYPYRLQIGLVKHPFGCQVVPFSIMYEYKVFAGSRFQPAANAFAVHRPRTVRIRSHAIVDANAK